MDKNICFLIIQNHWLVQMPNWTYNIGSYIALVLLKINSMYHAYSKQFIIVVFNACVIVQFWIPQSPWSSLKALIFHFSNDHLANNFVSFETKFLHFLLDLIGQSLALLRTFRSHIIHIIQVHLKDRTDGFFNFDGEEHIILFRFNSVIKIMCTQIQKNCTIF